MNGTMSGFNSPVPARKIADASTDHTITKRIRTNKPSTTFAAVGQSENLWNGCAYADIAFPLAIYFNYERWNEAPRSRLHLPRARNDSHSLRRNMDRNRLP